MGSSRNSAGEIVPSIAGNLGVWCRLLQIRAAAIALRLQKRRISRKAYCTLKEFSYDELKDIGLSSSDLQAVRSGVIFGDDTRRRRALPFPRNTCAKSLDMTCNFAVATVSRFGAYLARRQPDV